MRKFKHVKKQIEKKSNTLIFNLSSQAIKPFSRFFRRVFEANGIRQILGLIIIVAVISSVTLPVSLTTAQTTMIKNFSRLPEEIEVAKTERSVRLPVATFAITQGFHLFHPAIDLAATKGSPVYPIMVGTVVAVNQGRFGFGNYVIIDHGSGLKSLYAHLVKIEVKAGEKVEKDSILGLVGSSGRSTGPHLHLQIWEQNHLVNPRAFFEGYFGQRLASTR